MAESRPLVVEHLEDRTLRAAFGEPWRDPTHLTLSFAPDGTTIAGQPSALFQTLNAQFPSAAAWQNVILQAFQTWAAQANISIGLTTDSGAPFGVAGLMQGDARFGDIRIGAVPLDPDILAITVPPDPFMSGTLAGDMVLNSAAGLTPADLFDVALHEAGHSLGLPDIDDPDSVMDPIINPGVTGLAPIDVANIQAVYGTPAPDPYAANSTFATAAQIAQPPLYLGLTPLVTYGDLANLSDTNMFVVSPPLLYTGPVTIQLQTSGISFMQPELEVYNQNHKLLGEAQSTSDSGDVVSVDLPSVNLFQHYYIEVVSPSQNVFGTGRYALSVTYNKLSLVNPASLPALLSGPYDSLSAGDLAGLLLDADDVLFQLGQLTNISFLTADPLQNQPGYPTDTRYQTVTSLSYVGQVSYFRITAPPPAPGQPDLLTVSLAEMAVNGALPIVSVYDANTNPVPAEILLNGNGSYVIQTGGLTPGATYYFRVTAAPAPAVAVGNFSLVANFGAVASDLVPFVGGTLSQTDLADQYLLYIAQTQLFQFVLATSTSGPATNAQVSVQILNSAGQLVFSLIGQPGQTVSGASVLLTPGTYRVTVSIVNGNGKVPQIVYGLGGTSLSEPIGVAPKDPTNEPMYPCPGNPSVMCFCYSNGVYTTSPFLFSAPN
jgi:hypothetical protein